MPIDVGQHTWKFTPMPGLGPGSRCCKRSTAFYLEIAKELRRDLPDKPWKSSGIGNLNVVPGALSTILSKSWLDRVKRLFLNLRTDRSPT